MLRLFAKYTSIGVLNTLIALGRICFCVYGIYASGVGELFRFCYRRIVRLHNSNARFTFNASTTTSLHDVRGIYGNTERRVCLTRLTTGNHRASASCHLFSYQPDMRIHLFKFIVFRDFESKKIVSRSGLQ